ncbi:MAG TPA: catalase family peroxidase [Tepidisphaeraceae bacterium]|nr:catalase family peroxidase [Tepidisphaeraceae bacterium]
MSTETLAADLLTELGNLFGVHPGFRQVHAKGVMCHGTFTPTDAGRGLTRAPHVTRPSTPVIVRVSDFAGVPVIPDNAPEGASPRGMGIRFYLAEHVHTDIVAHSENGFPVRTGEEFLEFARAIVASGPNAAKPTPIEKYLSTHPRALKFATDPKPIPTSFARESFFAVSAFRFTNQAGVERYGRYRILPEAGNEYLSAEEAAKKSPNFLMDEIGQRLSKGPVRFRIMVQLAADGDKTDDATVDWPETRQQLELGRIELTKRANDADPELRKIILDPRPGVDGIAASADPLFELRAAIYILGGRRRRAAKV